MNLFQEGIAIAYEITFPENVMVDNIGSGRGTAPPGL